MTLTFGSIKNIQFTKIQSTASTMPSHDINGNMNHRTVPARRSLSNTFCNFGHTNYVNVAGSYDSFPRSASSRSSHSDKSSVCTEGDELRFATRKPHLVSLISGRHSNSVTLHPINKGITTLGSGGMGSIPDIVVMGTGIEPEHCVLQYNNDTVTIRPLATLVSIDGLRISRETKLTQGCMICFGRSNYFRFNHPSNKEEVLPSTNMSPFYPAVDNPEYYYMSSQSTLTDTQGSNQVANESNVKSCQSSNQKLNEHSTDDSDNDCPPEVPPRSEPPSLYVNTTPSDTNSFIGDYIYTKSDESTTSKDSAGVATIVSQDGTTTIHNNLYCSDLPPFCNPNLHGPPTYSKTSPMSPVESTKFPFPQVPAPPPPNSPPPVDSTNLNGFLPTVTKVSEGNKIHSSKIMPDSRFKKSKEDVSKNIADESLSLDEIISMCAEYERQTSSESVKCQSPHHTVTQNRIKTNGSLPRDKRSPTHFTGSPLPVMGLNSPSSLPHSPSYRGETPDEEIGNLFDGLLPNRNTTPGFSNSSPRSPYENVTSYNYLPQSPRTRIRTTFTKDNRETSPISSDSKISEFNTFGKIAKESRTPKSPMSTICFFNDSYVGGITNKYFDNPPKSSSRNTSKSKVFEEQMMKNIQDSLQVDNVNDEIERLKNEKQVVMSSNAENKLMVDDIERQENELIRGLEMERALLEAELATTRQQLASDEAALSILQLNSYDMDIRHQKERKADFDCMQCWKSRLDDAEESLEGMEWKRKSFHGTTEEETDMLQTLKTQHETVEAERKAFEDTEFSQMESEAHRESEREELNTEINDLTAKIENSRKTISDLESQVATMTESVCEEAEALEQQKKTLLSKINKDRMRLCSIDRQFCELERLGVTSINEPVSSSDTDESCAPELAEKLAKLHLLDRSQEDLDLINQVTSSSPLGYGDASMGRQASSTLQEIQRNRQILLAKKGTSVIDNERKRVEELKQRVANEVKAQWVTGKGIDQPDTNGTSLNSVEDEDSVGSSDIPVESSSSEDTHAQTSSNSSKQLRQRETDVTSDESIRPVSDASSFCDSDGVVRLRKDKSRTQRPLTRYLPVRDESPFDLRQHIETAGHQVDQCLHLTVTATSCRGYLFKLGSTFKTWRKRWFVFDRTKRAFIYYNDKNESKPHGGSYFQNIEDVYVNHQKKAPFKNATFCVKTHERDYHLMARSPETMRIWIDVIFTGAEGYTEFTIGT